MAIIRRVGGGPKPKPQRTRVELNLDPNQPPGKLTDYSILIYGNKKIGKTSLACEFPGAYVLGTEMGFKALRARGNFVRDRHETEDVVDQLVELNDPSLLVVVDTVDMIYEHIYWDVCNRLKISSPTEENDFGGTWRVIRKAFRAVVDKLLSLPGGVIFLSHDVEKEVILVTAEGQQKIDRVQPSMTKQAMGEVEGPVDIMAYYGYDGNQRYLWIDGSQTLSSGSRPKYNFIRRGGKAGVSGDRIKRIPMGGSSAEAYANLIKAFDNQQEHPEGTPPKTQLQKRKVGLSLKKS